MVNNPHEQEPKPAPETRVALVHVLTPEFHGLNPSDFDDINPDVVSRASADAIRASLIDRGDSITSPLKIRKNSGKSVVSYESGEPGERWVHLALTPKEFGLFSRHVEMLAKTAFNATLATRDEKLQKETANPAAKARSDEDIATAERASIRQVMGKIPKMEKYLASDIIPRIETAEKFIEMTNHGNLARGTHDSVSARFEHLRLYVFGDMLDAVGNQRGWSAELAKRAVSVLQKRLYIEGTSAERIENFREMLILATDYYSHKRAFVLTRIAETNAYIRKNPKATADVAAKDAERKQAKKINDKNL